MEVVNIIENDARSLTTFLPIQWNKHICELRTSTPTVSKKHPLNPKVLSSAPADSQDCVVGGRGSEPVPQKRSCTGKTGIDGCPEVEMRCAGIQKAVELLG